MAATSPQNPPPPQTQDTSDWLDPLFLGWEMENPARLFLGSEMENPTLPHEQIVKKRFLFAKAIQLRDVNRLCLPDEAKKYFGSVERSVIVVDEDNQEQTFKYKFDSSQRAYLTYRWNDYIKQKGFTLRHTSITSTVDQWGRLHIAASQTRVAGTVHLFRKIIRTTDTDRFYIPLTPHTQAFFPDSTKSYKAMDEEGAIWQLDYVFGDKWSDFAEEREDRWPHFAEEREDHWPDCAKEWEDHWPHFANEWKAYYNAKGLVPNGSILSCTTDGKGLLHLDFQNLVEGNLQHQMDTVEEGQVQHEIDGDQVQQGDDPT